MYLVVFKNDSLRPSVYGPFDNHESATAWGKNDAVGDEEFWVTKLIHITPDGLPCVDHLPVQHRDGKPPWCNDCGLTWGYEKPQYIFSKENNG